MMKQQLYHRIDQSSDLSKFKTQTVTLLRLMQNLVLYQFNTIPSTAVEHQYKYPYRYMEAL